MPEGAWDYFCLDRVRYHGHDLTVLFDKSGARYGDSATVGAGLPLLRLIRELVAGGDRIHTVEGVLSGSLAWLLSRYDDTRPFSDLVRAARDAAPDMRLALFANAALPGTARRTDFDLLGLNHLQLDLRSVADARRRGYTLQAWTVNDPARMARYMDLGVDDISTDVPAEAVRVREERAALNDVERLLARLHSWFRR